jgi:hypothetical protein
MRLADGWIVWQKFYAERDEALRAVGVDPGSVAPPNGP